MLICSKCGAVLEDDISFCTSCGTGTSTATRTEDKVSKEDLLPVEDKAEEELEKEAEKVEADASGAVGSIQETAEEISEETAKVAGTASEASAEATGLVATTAHGSGDQGSGSSTGGAKVTVGFIEAIKCFITKIIDFKSETGKMEFWFGFLFYVILCAVCVFSDDIPFVGWTFDLVLIAGGLAFISSIVRRLNNLKIPWYRIFIYIIPVYGQIRFVIEMLRPTV